LRPITIIRAVHWIAVVITGWSLNVLWGIDKAAGKGAPPQWERHVVGATLLLGIAALAISLAGRGGKAPGRIAIAVSTAGPLGALLISYILYNRAIDGQMPHLLAGSGWKWMTAGGILGLGAAVGSLLQLFGNEGGEKSASKPGRSGRSNKKKRKR
jgi:hypothetical protein